MAKETIRRDVVVIGGGPAGLAAAIEAKRNGAKSVTILERNHEAGGILQQCIHTGFGLHIFGEELTGPEYAGRFIDEAHSEQIEILLDAMVMHISQQRVVTVLSAAGLMDVEAGAVVLAMGCRERTRGAIGIAGTRPAGIFTAGAAQRYMNIEGYMPGKNVVILGSGDIGLIMARRMTLEGATVKMVLEAMPFSGGLTRNIVQCLNDFDIPLRLSHTVVQVHGKKRLEGVTVAALDQNRRPIPETMEYVACDTLLLSVGLIPENELSLEMGVALDALTQGPVVTSHRETSVPGVFACGNVVHVHDLVDNVTAESRIAGRYAAAFAADPAADAAARAVRTQAGRGVRYIVPQNVLVSAGAETCKLLFRVSDIYEKAKITARCGDTVLGSVRNVTFTPGEMESIEIDTAALSGCGEDAVITVSLD